MPTRPSYKAAVLTWIAVYPTITLVLAAIQSLGLADLALPLRTLIATIVVVPAVVLGLTPALAWLLRGWLHPTEHTAGDQQPLPRVAHARVAQQVVPPSSRPTQLPN